LIGYLAEPDTPGPHPAILHEITIYSGVGHGFLDEENYNQPGTPGDAWQQTLAFLEANLKSAN
jgi:dienelactone hydrolase